MENFGVDGERYQAISVMSLNQHLDFWRTITRCLIALMVGIIPLGISAASTSSHLAPPAECIEGDDRWLSAAIQDARAKSAHTVYVPNGTYVICDTITLDQKRETLSIIGESRERTVLQVIPGGDAGPVFNLDRAGGFDHLNVAIKNLTITYGQRGRIFTGHGIRVGNGWRSGSLLIENVAILYAPGYGIGIQNHRDGDLPATNVTIRDVYIAHTGSDGIDTKRSPSGNSNLLIENIVIRNIGLDDARSASALDISYDHFILRNVSIIAQSCIETDAAYRRVGRECELAKADPTKSKDKLVAVCNQKPVSCNVGIQFRERDSGSASFGLAENIYIKGVAHGIFFAGRTKPNKHIKVNQFIIEDFTHSGLYLRGAFNEVTNGCAFDPADPLAVGREIHLGSPLDRASTTVEWGTVGSEERFCPLED